MNRLRGSEGRFAIVVEDVLRPRRPGDAGRGASR